MGLWLLYLIMRTQANWLAEDTALSKVILGDIFHTGFLERLHPSLAGTGSLPSVRTQHWPFGKREFGTAPPALGSSCGIDSPALPGWADVWCPALRASLRIAILTLAHGSFRHPSPSPDVLGPSAGGGLAGAKWRNSSTSASLLAEVTCRWGTKADPSASLGMTD